MGAPGSILVRGGVPEHILRRESGIARVCDESGEANGQNCAQSRATVLSCIALQRAKWFDRTSAKLARQLFSRREGLRLQYWVGMCLWPFQQAPTLTGKRIYTSNKGCRENWPERRRTN